MNTQFILIAIKKYVAKPVAAGLSIFVGVEDCEDDNCNHIGTGYRRDKFNYSGSYAIIRRKL